MLRVLDDVPKEAKPDKVAKVEPRPAVPLDQPLVEVSLPAENNVKHRRFEVWVAHHREDHCVGGPRREQADNRPHFIVAPVQPVEHLESRTNIHPVSGGGCSTLTFLATRRKGERNCGLP